MREDRVGEAGAVLALGAARGLRAIREGFRVARAVGPMALGEDAAEAAHGPAYSAAVTVRGWRARKSSAISSKVLKRTPAWPEMYS